MKKNYKWIAGLLSIVVVVLVLAFSFGIIPKPSNTVDNGTNTVVNETNETIEFQVGDQIVEQVKDTGQYIEDKKEAVEPVDIADLEAYEQISYHKFDDDEYDTYEDVLNNVPEYAGKQYIVINKNYSYFTDIPEETYITYSELDSLGRAGAVYGMFSPDTRQKEDRVADLSVITPSGWNQCNVKEKYGIVLQPYDYPFLMNRCHLVGYAIGGGETEVRDIITGTYAFNMEMLKFEKSVLDFIDICEEPILYRVTPVYKGNELICRGVLIEAYDVETKGKFINFNVFVFNVQPEFEIDYNTGEETKVS